MSENPKPASALVRLSILVHSIHADVARKYGLTLAQAHLLCAILDRAKSMKTVADELQADKASLSGLVDRAQQRGLVVRQTQPDDRRVIKIDLTNTGRSLASSFQSETRDRIGSLAGLLSEEDRKRFMFDADRIVLASGGVLPSG